MERQTMLHVLVSAARASHEQSGYALNEHVVACFDGDACKCRKCPDLVWGRGGGTNEHVTSFRYNDVVGPTAASPRISLSPVGVVHPGR